MKTTCKVNYFLESHTGGVGQGISKQTACKLIGKWKLARLHRRMCRVSPGFIGNEDRYGKRVLAERSGR